VGSGVGGAGVGSGVAGAAVGSAVAVGSSVRVASAVVASCECVAVAVASSSSGEPLTLPMTASAKTTPATTPTFCRPLRAVHHPATPRDDGCSGLASTAVVDDGTSAVPHLMQKLALAGSVVPHCGHDAD
jgi:hypothetical protein